MELNSVTGAAIFWTASVLLITLYTASLIVYRLFLSPLAKFPGPKHTAICGWVATYYDVWKEGQFSNQVNKWHEQYGLSYSELCMLGLSV